MLLKVCPSCHSPRVRQHVWRGVNDGLVEVPWYLHPDDSSVRLERPAIYSCLRCGATDDPRQITDRTFRALVMADAGEVVARIAALVLRCEHEAFESQPRIALDRTRQLVQIALADGFGIGSATWDRHSFDTLKNASAAHRGGIVIEDRIIRALGHFIVAELWREGVCHLHGMTEVEGEPCKRCDIYDDALAGRAKRLKALVAKARRERT